MLRYELPYPPSTNGLFFNATKGRRKTIAYRNWLDAAGWQIVEQGRRSVHGPVSISVALVKPDKRKRDLDNLMKPILDLLVEMGCIDDDSFVKRISVQWAEGGPGCAVIIQQAERELAA